MTHAPRILPDGPRWYRACLKLGRLWHAVWPILLALAAVGWLWASVACTVRPFVPEIPQPSPARMAELLAATTVRPEPRAASVQIALTPGPHILAGSAVWVRCLVPGRTAGGRVRYGLRHVRESDVPLDRGEYALLVERVECGTWAAFCRVDTGETFTLREQVLEAHGSCTDTEGRR